MSTKKWSCFRKTKRKYSLQKKKRFLFCLTDKVIVHQFSVACTRMNKKIWRSANMSFFHVQRERGTRKKKMMKNKTTTTTKKIRHWLTRGKPWLTSPGVPSTSVFFPLHSLILGQDDRKRNSRTWALMTDKNLWILVRKRTSGIEHLLASVEYWCIQNINLSSVDSIVVFV